MDTINVFSTEEIIMKIIDTMITTMEEEELNTRIRLLRSPLERRTTTTARATIPPRRYNDDGRVNEVDS